MKKLLIVGAGGFGREMHAWARQHPDHGRVWTFGAFLDDNPAALKRFGDFAPVRPLTGHRPAADEVFLCGLGLPPQKEQLIAPLVAAGAAFLTFIHPRALVGEPHGGQGGSFAVSSGRAAMEVSPRARPDPRLFW